MQTAAVEDRRQELRLSGGGGIKALILDAADQPLDALCDTQVLNISAGGLALLTSTEVKPGMTLHITASSAPKWTPGSGHFHAKVLRAAQSPNGTRTLACRLVKGQMPAALIYKW